MWENILNLALGNGLFAAMFVGLMMYILKDSSKREQKYQETEAKYRETIDKLSSCLQAVNELAAAMKELRKDVGEMLRRSRGV